MTQIYKAGEVPKKAKLSGTLSVGSTELNRTEIKKFSGFVFQDDVILDTMTVKEAIEMSARLRLPKELDKQARVQKSIETFSLSKAQNTQIGSPGGKKGISGGERKRTSKSTLLFKNHFKYILSLGVAMELITEPKVLFLDEPTSGLDAYTAFSLIKTLTDYAHEQKKTLVATIHQPSSEIFYLFDDLLLLEEGEIVFYGPVESVIEYFTSIGFDFPKYSNPADFLFMNVLHNADFAMLKESWLHSSLYAQMRAEMEISSQVTPMLIDNYRAKASFWTQFKYLMNRASKNAFRNELIIRVRLIQSIFIGLLAGLVFINATGGTIAGQIQSLSGVLYFLAVNQFFGSATAVLSIFAVEKTVFMREFQAGYYSLTAYYLSKVLVELPHQIIFPLLTFLIAYYIIGLYPAFSIFLLSGVLLVFCAICGTAIGTFISAIFDDVAMALAALPLVLLPILLFSGLFVNSGNFPSWLSWLQWGSPVRYAFSGLLRNQFSNYTFNNCPGTLAECSGQRAIEQLGFAEDLPIGATIAILGGIYLILVIGGYLILYAKTRR